VDELEELGSLEAEAAVLSPLGVLLPLDDFSESALFSEDFALSPFVLPVALLRLSVL
jgi:hypothetical protein